VWSLESSDEASGEGKRISFHSQILVFSHAFAGRNFPSEGVEGTARK